MAEVSEINDIPPRVMREHNRNERPAGAQIGAQAAFKHRRGYYRHLAGTAGWAEQMAHQRLAGCHVHAEWFRPRYAYLAREAIEFACRKANQVPEEWVRAGNDPAIWKRAPARR